MLFHKLYGNVRRLFARGYFMARCFTQRPFPGPLPQHSGCRGHVQYNGDWYWRRRAISYCSGFRASCSLGIAGAAQEGPGPPAPPIASSARPARSCPGRTYHRTAHQPRLCRRKTGSQSIRRSAPGQGLAGELDGQKIEADRDWESLIAPAEEWESYGHYDPSPGVWRN